MKKICLLMALLMVLGFAVGCSDSETNGNDDDAVVTKKKNNGGEGNSSIDGENGGDGESSGKQKISGTFDFSAGYSEGKAFVSLDGDAYCIDKKGYVLFKTNADFYDNSLFENGMALLSVDGDYAICDEKGKITRPEDVGATKFHECFFEEGYIIAEVNEYTYSSTVNKMGIMNTKFEWVVEPSEELYNEMRYESKLCYNDMIFYGITSYSDKNYVDLKTGKIVKVEELSLQIPSSMWEWDSGSGKYVEKITRKTVLGLPYDNIYSTTDFINGKSAVEFYNYDANKHYFTLVDESGKLLFEPKEFEGDLMFDGNNIMCSNNIKMAVYDLQGNLLCQKEYDSYNTWKVSDGVIMRINSAGFSLECSFYDMNLEPLF